jgi:hypothetical protein
MNYFRVEPRQPNSSAQIEFCGGAMTVQPDQPSTIQNFPDNAELLDRKTRLLHGKPNSSPTAVLNNG